MALQGYKQNDLMSLFTEFFPKRHLNLSNFENTVPYPKCNLETYDDRYVYSLDIPGMKREDLEIIEENGYVTVSGHRQTKVEKDEPKYKYYESSYGKFSRSFVLENDSDGKNMEAALADGVLKLVIPRVTENRGRKIEIN